MFTPTDHLHPYVSEDDTRTLETLHHELHCPKCTADFATRGFSAAFWRTQEIVYVCWCHECSWFGEITELSRVIADHPIEEHVSPLSVVK